MSDDTYNGWTNYETWAVGLFLDGNYDGEGTYRHVLDLARECSDRTDAPADAVYELANALEELVTGEDGYMPDLGASIYSDLLNAALSEVNWRELAEHKISEVAEDA